MIISRTGRCSLAVTLAFGLLFARSAAADECHPDLDPSLPQYIVGYGSLMQAASKSW